MTTGARKLPPSHGRLALTRKDGEAIIIGGDTRVLLLWACDGHAKIVIEAPKTITIAREELLDDH